MPSTTLAKPSPSINELFAGGGEIGALMRAKDWSTTPLGPPEQWPQSLRTAVRIILLSRYPMFIWWGKELVNLYNDRYVPMLGGKHPACLGGSGREAWKDIWEEIRPRVEAVVLRGEATFDDALLLMTDRHGYLEETYFTFSYSPLPDDAGKIGGLFCAVTEETNRVISERRMALLRKLASSTADVRTSELVCQRASECLEEANKDLPFALIYLRDPGTKVLHLSCSAGISASHPAAPATLEPGSTEPWPAGDDLAHGSSLIIDNLGARFSDLPTGGWSTPPHRALLVPLSQQGQSDPAGVLFAAINPHRELDEEFRGFLGLIAGQIASGLANANAYNAERKRAEALAELDRAKTTFFSNVSHEFRTPLTLMLGPTEQALASRARALSGPELERVHRNELRLLKLVNSLLDFSRLETARVKAKYQPTDLAALTGELASVFRSAIKRAGLTFKVKAPSLSQQVYIDREMWEKIVLNLLSNALKSTFEGGITVAVRDAGDHAEVSVADTGTGIPESEIPHLFERFRRVENARRRTHEGSGIGLALVHELVRMHGGTIDVKSVVDQGSTFTISIPFGKSHLQADALVAESTSQSTGLARRAFLNEALSWLGVESPTKESVFISAVNDHEGYEVEAAQPRPNHDRARVLLVDDNRDMREYVERLLKDRFEVATAENGRAAIDIAIQNPPDLVLSDVMMPEMDGYQLLAALRKTAATATVPVILLSARAGEEARVEGMEAGADDYLIKPFSARELLARVQAHINMAEFRKRAIEHELQLEGELQNARRFAAEAVEHISDSFFALDSEWRFTYLNPKAIRRAAKAGQSGDLLGKNLLEAFPGLQGTEFEEQYRRCMEARTPVHFEAPHKRRWYSVRAYPSPRGGMVVYAVDVTARKAAESQLRMKQEHLQLTQKVSKIGTWELDVEDEYLTISREFAEIMGLSPHSTRLSRGEFLGSLFLSSDREKAERVLERALRDKKEFSIELRVMRPDGSVRLVSNRGKGLYNQGKPVVLGVLVDVTSSEAAAANSTSVRSKSKAKARKTA
ncbi:MAG TPA: response regulator [Terriglobales bacterium]